MGNVATRENCFFLKDLPAAVLAKIVDEDYTVLRTDGRNEPGWKISLSPHCDSIACGTSCRKWHDGAGSRLMEIGVGGPGVRIAMHNGFYNGDTKVMSFNQAYLRDEDGEFIAPKPNPQHKHTCGWRSFTKEHRGFWPTRMGDENSAEKEVWFKWMDDQLDTLKSSDELKGALPLEEKKVE